MRRFGVSLLTGFAAAASLSAANAQTLPSEQVLITASAIRSLDMPAPTGSRLGLSVRELPATLDSIGADEILRRGLTSIADTVQALPGVLAAYPPGDMGNFSMRGFTGNQIALLNNGVYIGPPTMIARPGNAFNLEGIELLKGPASVLYGREAIGGALNLLRKRARFGTREVLLLGSYGSFGTAHLGADISGHLTDGIAARAVVSRTSTKGYVRRDHADSFNGTVSLLWRAGPDFEAELSLDYLEDNPSRYFGTPIVPAAAAVRPLDVFDPESDVTIDREMRFVSYNVADAVVHSQQYWPQLRLAWTPAANVEVRNVAYYLKADRQWLNSEVYTYNPLTDRVDRDRFFVFHDQEMWGNEATLAHRHALAGMANAVLVGVTYSHLDFVRSRGFPDGDSVDRFHPEPGLFGPIVERRSPTVWDSYAVFFEDALDVAPRLKLVAGGRFETLDLDRKNFNADGTFNAGTSFARSFQGLTWRAGLVYELSETITPYASYATGNDPAGSGNFLLVNARENFDLAKAVQAEVGLKASTPGRQANLTIALYSLERRNILTQITAAGDLSNIGNQKSSGLEASGDILLTPDWSLMGSLAYTDAKFGRFFDPDFGIEASGNRPPNVARWVWTLWTVVGNIGGLPLEAGGGLRHVGSRFTSTSNELRMRPYTVADLSLAYDIRPNVRLMGRVKNLFDEAYVLWADIFYPSEVIMGPPRTFEASLISRF